MACKNCFNGCTETVSDQCVKYTGIDIPLLGISHGDTLAHIEKVLTEYITKIIDGTGVFPVIPSGVICAYVQAFLPPCCGPYTVNDFIAALIKTACALDGRVTNLETYNASLDSEYDIGCLTGVTGFDGTHIILQATIDELCIVKADLTALDLKLTTQYTKTADLANYINSVIASSPTANIASNKMIPFTAIEYYGVLAGYPTVADGFSAGGVGYGYWLNVYICNGQPGTPDKRGRVAVGAIVDAGGPPLPAQTDPATPLAGNPNYAVGTAYGANVVVLTEQQMPIHKHDSEVDVSQIAHSHVTNVPLPDDEDLNESFGGAVTGNKENQFHDVPTNAVMIDIEIGVDVKPKGNSEPHPNIQPTLPCHYIMYIP